MLYNVNSIQKQQPISMTTKVVAFQDFQKGGKPKGKDAQAKTKKRKKNHPHKHEHASMHEWEHKEMATEWTLCRAQ